MGKWAAVSFQYSEGFNDIRDEKADSSEVGQAAALGRGSEGSGTGRVWNVLRGCAESFSAAAEDLAGEG